MDQPAIVAETARLLASKHAVDGSPLWDTVDVVQSADSRWFWTVTARRNVGTLNEATVMVMLSTGASAHGRLAGLYRSSVLGRAVDYRHPRWRDVHVEASL